MESDVNHATMWNSIFCLIKMLLTWCIILSEIFELCSVSLTTKSNVILINKSLQNSGPDILKSSTWTSVFTFRTCRVICWNCSVLTLSDPTSDLVRQYDFPVLLRCWKTSDTVFVAFVHPLSESVQCFSSCFTDFSQQIAQVVLFLFLHVFLF
jgi:hypothetical protein